MSRQSSYEVRTIDDNESIASVLERDRRMTVYALADLDPPYRDNARFIGALRHGIPTAILLLYRLPSAIALLPCGDRNGIEAILTQEPDLPDRVFLLAHGVYLHAVATRYTIQDRWPMDRMVLTARRLRPTPSVALPIRRLSDSDFARVRDLYALWHDTFFDEVMLRSGVYFGAFDGEDLIAVAGTHVVSPGRRLACIGGVFTHPSYRGRGLATAATGAVCTTLVRVGIELIALNVKQGNAPAIAAYTRLGFECHDMYFEGHATLAALRNESTV